MKMQVQTKAMVADANANSSSRDSWFPGSNSPWDLHAISGSKSLDCDMLLPEHLCIKLSHVNVIQKKSTGHGTNTI